MVNRGTEEVKQDIYELIEELSKETDAVFVSAIRKEIGELRRELDILWKEEES